MKIYVGNLSFTVTVDQLRDLFGRHGQVEDAYIVTERDSQKPRGFAFVIMTDSAEARTAIEAMNGFALDGQPLSVNEAKTKSKSAGSPSRRLPGSRRRPINRPPRR